MKIIKVDGLIPIKLWTDYVSVEEEALKQLHNLSSMPFVYHHVAAMPDVHWGMGATVGSVIATKGAIIPAAVGVDIGCGMMAVKTPLNASNLPDDLSLLRSKIENSIPHGRTDNGGSNDRGRWHELPHEVYEHSISLRPAYTKITSKYPKITPKQDPWCHMGTLGSGNHFIELCLDQNDSVWVMLHSGSRGIGNKIGTFFIEQAKEEMLKYHIDKYLPDMDLSYLVEHTEIFSDYIDAVDWAQKFALKNREIMMQIVLNVLSNSFKRIYFQFPEGFELSSIKDKAINCHHNYVQKEHHFGSNVLLTRKGAVRAREGDLGIIPGSMGAKSFIVKGKGNPESFNSCSHGAGRSMSRTQAKKQFTVEDHIKATQGVECRKDEDVIDETPMAYKDIDDVMKSQADLVDIVYTLKQVICVKG